MERATYREQKALFPVCKVLAEAAAAATIPITEEQADRNRRPLFNLLVAGNQQPAGATIVDILTQVIIPILLRIIRLSKPDQIELFQIVKTIAVRQLGITVETDPTKSDYPLIDLIMEIIKKGQENGWPLVKLLLEVLLPLIISLL